MGWQTMVRCNLFFVLFFFEYKPAFLYFGFSMPAARAIMPLVLAAGVGVRWIHGKLGRQPNQFFVEVVVDRSQPQPNSHTKHLQNDHTKI